MARREGSAEHKWRNVSLRESILSEQNYERDQTKHQAIVLRWAFGLSIKFHQITVKFDSSFPASKRQK